MENLLEKYKRQPKIFVDAPSQFRYIDSSVYSGESFKDIPVYSMTGADEIAMKAPEALLNGEAVKKLIESCIPRIKDAGLLSQIDIEYFLIAIRQATFGSAYDKLTICKHCNEENKHGIDLNDHLDNYHKKVYKDTCTIDNLKFFLKPLTYNQWNEVQLELFKANRTMMQAISAEKLSEEEKNQYAKNIYNIIESINQKTILYQVHKVKDNELEITDHNVITKFILENDRKFFNGIQSVIKENTQEWDLPKLNLTCAACNETYIGILTLDDSSFFAD